MFKKLTWILMLATALMLSSAAFATNVDQNANDRDEAALEVGGLPVEEGTIAQEPTAEAAAVKAEPLFGTVIDGLETEGSQLGFVCPNYGGCTYRLNKVDYCCYAVNPSPGQNCPKICF